MKIISIQEIKNRINLPKMIADQERGFVNYSQGKAIVPPVGHMAFKDPPGDYHIKYGMIADDDIFVIKIAGGFYQNRQLHNIPSVQGLMLVICAKTGQPLVLLEDGGYLTNLRTAIAGLLAAKHVGPKSVQGIGIIGTGQQARFQAEILSEHTPCQNLWVWGRNSDNTQEYANEMNDKGFNFRIAKTPRDLARNCNLIVTTTNSSAPILMATDIMAGTHITAVGADAKGKQELDPSIFAKADICVVDSKSQCLDHGEVCSAFQAGMVPESKLVELGTIITDSSCSRQHESDISVADLTGVATQDIQIARSVIGASPIRGPLVVVTQPLAGCRKRGVLPIFPRV